MFVKEILHNKGHEIKSVRPEDLLETCAAHMRLARIGALLVCDENNRLKGILSERDVVEAIVDHGPRALQLPASKFMSRHPVTCTSEDTIASVAATMTVRRVRHIPVVDKDKISGIISIGDIVKARFEEMELERDTLRDLAMAHQIAS